MTQRIVTNDGQREVLARQPAEWETHDACWLAWPSHGDLWQEDLEPARAEFAALCRAISGIDYPDPIRPAEKLEILVPDAGNEKLAREALGRTPAAFHRAPFGDIWLRDTGPIFVHTGDGSLVPTRFGFNGWGGKYVLPFDDTVSSTVAKLTSKTERAYPWILEGGSIEVDGRGTCLTTRQCLLNPNRNKTMTQAEIEQGLHEALGISKCLWLDKGLRNDHTDGHIDTLARFVRPGLVVCMLPAGERASDPNAEVLERIHEDLTHFTDADGGSLEVVTVPSPGKVTGRDGSLLAASYMNFYIGNRTVVVPVYGSPYDGAAVEKIAALFPERKTIGLSARAILAGGGAFHCITQQQPRPYHPRREK